MVSVVVLLLAGAAFMGLRLLNGKSIALADIVGSISGNFKNGKGSPIQITFDPAPELPKSSQDLVGEVTGLQDNSVFVAVKNKTDAQTAPPVEVVLTRDTKIYRDATLDNLPPPTQSRRMQQVVDLVDRSQLAETDILEIWGQKRGERLNAEVIVIHGPEVLHK